MCFNKKQSIITTFTILFILFLKVAIAEQVFDFKTLTEQKFDKDIENVAFDTYEENGQTKYYPKIVVLREPDPSASSQSDMNHQLEVRILDRNGRTIWRLQNLQYFSRVYLSENGNYFAIYHARYKKQLDDENEKEEIIASALTVYNDKGKMCWQRKEIFDDIPEVKITVSSKNEALIAMIPIHWRTEKWKFPYYYFDVTGNKHPLLREDQIIRLGAWFTSNSFLLGWYDLKIKKHGYTLFNESGKILFNQSLDIPLHNLTISQQGTYIFVGSVNIREEPQVEKKFTQPTKTVTSNVISGDGYIYNNKGVQLMNISLPLYSMGQFSGYFSKNERYLLLHLVNPKQNNKSEEHWFVVQDILNKSELYRAKLPDTNFPNPPYIISDNGEIAVRTGKNLYMWNNKGELLYTKDLGIQLVFEKVERRGKTIIIETYPDAPSLLDWIGSQPLLQKISNKEHKVQIIGIEKRSRK